MSKEEMIAVLTVAACRCATIAENLPTYPFPKSLGEEEGDHSARNVYANGKIHEAVRAAQEVTSSAATVLQVYGEHIE